MTIFFKEPGDRKDLHYGVPVIWQVRFVVKVMFKATVLLYLIQLLLLKENELGVVEVRGIGRIFVEHQAVYID